MNTIGFRATPKTVFYSIYDSANEVILNSDQIVIPIAFETPDALKYVRSNILDILREYSVEQAGVRTTEPNSQRKNIERIQIEGVIIEAFASSSMKRFYFGQISSMAARLGIQREEIKPHIDGDTDPGIPGWADLPKEEREAILCAMGAENA